MQVLEFSTIMDWNSLSTRCCECPLFYSSSSRVLSSLFSSTSSYSRTDTRRLQRLHSQLKGSSVPRKTLVSHPEVSDGFRSNVERGNGNTSSFFVRGDKDSLPSPLYFPSKTSLIVEDDCQEKEDEEDSSIAFHHYHDIENQDGEEVLDIEEEFDGEEELGEEAPPLALQSRVENYEGIPVKEWFLKFFNSIDPHVRGIILLNMLTFLYGSNITVIKETEGMLDAATFTAGRFAIAALVFTPCLKTAFEDPAVTKAGLELGMWASFAYLTQALGLMTTGAGRASFFTTFTVIVVPLFAGLLGKKIPLLTWFAAVAALFGVGLLETSGAPPSIGDAWNLASAVVFGIHLLRTELHSRALPQNKALPIIALQIYVITGFSIVWSLASHLTAGDVLPNFFTLDWPALFQTTMHLPWVAMVYTGLFTTAFCLSAELMAMRDVSATEAAVISTLEPLWGAAFAWFLLGERWGLRGWVGAAFILGGSTVTQIWGAPEETKPLAKEAQDQGLQVKEVARAHKEGKSD